MLDYIKGFAFVIVYLIFMLNFGNIILRKKYKNANYVHKFIVGYITFSFLVAIVGIPMQIFGFPWKYFAIYLICILIGIFIYSFYVYKKENIIIFNEGIKEVIKNYWFLFFLALVLVAMSTVFFEWYWLNNGLDDGYYITRMVSLPYDGNLLSISASTGLHINNSIFNSYNLNVFDLEASVYLFFLKMNPTLFARGFLAYINYFLFISVIYIFAEKLINISKLSIKRTYIQFIPLIIVIFSFSYDLMTSTNMHHLMDAWQNTTAMYYGSSIVRNMGIPLLFLTLIDEQKMSIKKILTYAIISVVLISKSTIALPFIVVVFLSYIILLLLQKKEFIKVLSLLFCLVILGLLFGNNSSIETVYNDMMIQNLTSILIICSIALSIWLLIFKINICYQILCFIFIMLFLTIANPINNIFEKFAVYDFVACRFMTGIFVFLIIYTFTGVLLIIFSKIQKDDKYIHVMFATLLICFSILGTLSHSNFQINTLKNDILTFIENPYFVPNSVVALGNNLEQLSEDTNKKINVICPEGIGVNNKSYSLAISLRQFAPKVVSISALERYASNNDTNFLDYDVKNQEIFANFTSNPSNDTALEFKKVLDKYPINCIVTVNNNLDRFIDVIGFKQYKVIEYQNTYYIYYR